MKLGPFEIDHPFILAPMAGITNSPFRRLMRRMDSAIVISELVSANGLEYGGERTRRMLKYHDQERILGFQIFGERPELLVKACQYIESLGADFIDLNLGCPVPKIVKKGAGSALCKEPTKLYKFLVAMVESVKLPITIKIRTGWDQSTRNAKEIVQLAYDAGVKWVAIHGRTRAQGYNGEADWEFIAEVKATSPLPIIGNGDLNTPEKAVQYFKKYGTDAVMIGRGALRNPFIFQQAKDLLNEGSYQLAALDDYLDLMLLQREYLEAAFPRDLAVLHTRKFLSWYAAGFPNCHAFRKQVFTIEEPDQLWTEAMTFFREGAKRRDTSFLSQPFLMGGHG